MSNKEYFTILGEKMEPKVRDFVKHIGLFSCEISHYLGPIEGMQPKYLGFKSADFYFISESLLAGSYALSTAVRQGKTVRIAPNQNIFHADHYPHGLSAYTRIVYEALENEKENSATLLDFIVTNENSTLRDARKEFGNASANERVQRLESLRLLRVEDKKLVPSTAASQMLSPKTKQLWKKLENWEHRIDIW